MIQLKVSNLGELDKELNNKAEGIKELTRPAIMQQFSQSVFAILKRQVLVDVNRFARSNPERLHHVYEWGRVGDNRSRLFDLTQISASPTRLVVGTVLRESRSRVPVAPELAAPGPTGKFVKATAIFRNKAEMMESGKKVSTVAKKTIVFMADGNMVFRSRGQRINRSMPDKTRGQFDLYIKTWYATKANDVIEKSRIYRDIEIATAEALNVTGGGANRVRERVLAAIKKYDVVVTDV